MLPHHLKLTQPNAHTEKKWNRRRRLLIDLINCWLPPNYRLNWRLLTCFLFIYFFIVPTAAAAILSPSFVLKPFFFQIIEKKNKIRFNVQWPEKRRQFNTRVILNEFKPPKIPPIRRRIQRTDDAGNTQSINIYLFIYINVCKAGNGEKWWKIQKAIPKGKH